MHHHDTPRVPTPGDATDTAIISAHIIDDLSTALATARRALAEIEALLDDLPTALRDGATDVVAEYVDRAHRAATQARHDTTGAGCLP